MSRPRSSAPLRLTRDVSIGELAEIAQIRPVEIQKRLASFGYFVRTGDPVPPDAARRLWSSLWCSLSVEGDQTLESIDQLVAEFEPIFRQPDPPLWLSLDLTRLGFIYPPALALLTTAVLKLSLDGVSTAVQRPANQNVDDYLNRMDFYRLAGVEAQYRWTRRSSTGRFLEVKQVGSEAEGDSIVSDILRILERRMATLQPVRKAVQYALHELINNVFHHARSATKAIVCAQSYDQKREVELSVVDSGRGIRASLMDNPELGGRFSTPREAIELAVQPQVTGRPEDNTGEGLFFTLEFLKENRGCACVHSEEGRLRIKYGQPLLQDGAFWPGTLVALRFRTDRPVDTASLFAKYAPKENDYEWLFD